MSVDEALPNITSQPGTVGSRFVSQNDLDQAKARREEQWKAAYARLGQEPPPQPTEDVYDGRSLAEKLAANKVAKQEEWEEKTKLANQFRALEEDEIQFLESIRDEEQRKALKRKHEDAEEVKGFKEAVAARNAIPASARLQGVVVKKKPTKPAPSEPKVAHPSKPLQATKSDDVSTNTEKDDETQTGSNKKPKISPSSS
ncbi:hypothetical protein PNOK_0240900 [Pyrrhoderma noxium]|uniref:FAM192A/Fyv6 N-terminal domain-containing protein n=1 Tax=Pyrrhoderma noxium TaxID=2282107 RepID=A0A286USE6_9AGAM|nr:hypothetical protein PNOK_0240900 [Pyrrhoderma noxium]